MSGNFIILWLKAGLVCMLIGALMNLIAIIIVLLLKLKEK